MQLNIKVIKKWYSPHFSINPPSFQGYAPFLAKFVIPPQVTQFFEGATPLPWIRWGGEGGVPTMCVFDKAREHYGSSLKIWRTVNYPDIANKNREAAVK